MSKTSLINRIKSLFETEEENNTLFVDVKTTDSRILRVSDMAVGATVMEITEEGEVAVEDGEYTLEDGMTIVVMGGLIEEIKEVEEEETEEPEAEVEVTEEMETEKFLDVALKDGPIVHVVTTTEGELSIGDRVLLDGMPVGPGEHVTADGTIIVTDENGIIIGINDAVAEEVVEEPVAQTEEEKEITGVVNNLKELINQVKELKSQFEDIKSENEQLKLTVSKFAAAPSEAPTKTKVNFNKVNKDERLKFFSQK